MWAVGTMFSVGCRYYEVWAVGTMFSVGCRYYVQCGL